MLLQLTKDDTNYLKAIAIILIVLHNYLHFIPPHFGENEMYFSAKVIWGVIQKVSNDFTLLPKLILSSFGHFGVQTFIFLSGYGLAKSFASNPTQRIVTFTLKHIYKVYFLLFVGLCFLRVGRYIGLSKVSTSTLLEFGFKRASLLSNFSIDTLFELAGPWWFIGFIVQMYLLFPWLFKLFKRFGGKALFGIFLVTYVILLSTGPLVGEIKFPMYGNFIGHLPEFSFGIFMAIYPQTKITIPVCVSAFIVFILGNFYAELFPFTFLAFTVFSVPLFCLASRSSPKILKQSFMYIGYLSAYMFIINGPMRKYFIELGKGSSSQAELFLLAFTHLFCVILAAFIISMIIKWLGIGLDKAKSNFINRTSPLNKTV